MMPSTNSPPLATEAEVLEVLEAWCTEVPNCDTPTLLALVTRSDAGPVENCEAPLVLLTRLEEGNTNTPTA